MVGIVVLIHFRPPRRTGPVAETIACLMQEADVDLDEAASMFEEVTGKPLKRSLG